MKNLEKFRQSIHHVERTSSVYQQVEIAYCFRSCGDIFMTLALPQIAPIMQSEVIHTSHFEADESWHLENSQFSYHLLWIFWCHYLPIDTTSAVGSIYFEGQKRDENGNYGNASQRRERELASDDSCACNPSPSMRTSCRTLRFHADRTDIWNFGVNAIKSRTQRH
jgi:hypothetical protein